MRIALPLMLFGSCRGWHEAPPFDECQPYGLECEACTFDADVALGSDLLRIWECDEPDLGRLLAVRRRAVDLAASDTHFYEAATGLRVASVREHDERLPICGREGNEEWWGEILACVDGCELDGTLPEADPELPECT